MLLFWFLQRLRFFINLLRREHINALNRVWFLCKRVPISKRPNIILSFINLLILSWQFFLLLLLEIIGLFFFLHIVWVLIFDKLFCLILLDLLKMHEIIFAHLIQQLFILMPKCVLFIRLRVLISWRIYILFPEGVFLKCHSAIFLIGEGKCALVRVDWIPVNFLNLFLSWSLFHYI